MQNADYDNRPKPTHGFNECFWEKNEVGNCVLVVGKNADNTFSYGVYIWDLTDFEYVGSGCWSDIDISGKYESLELAEREGKLAIEVR